MSWFMAMERNFAKASVYSFSSATTARFFSDEKLSDGGYPCV